MDRELTLDELLDEPIVRLLMRRDGVAEEDLRALAGRLRRDLDEDSSARNDPRDPGL